ncbi:MAG: DUF4058 family protein, partial [Chloroflexi bacterium]|nr:DUF4058 family protein [Chloroflexota bacterium]
MPHPFPGMNPWLERPGLWQDVHDSLIVAIRDALSPAVLPKYYIAIQERAVITALTEDDGDRVVGKPDVAAVLSDEGVALRASAAMAVALAEPIEVSVPYDDQIAETYLEVYEAAAQRLVTVVEILSPTNKRPGKRRNEYEEK